MGNAQSGPSGERPPESEPHMWFMHRERLLSTDGLRFNIAVAVTVRTSRRNRRVCRSCAFAAEADSAMGGSEG